MQMMQNMVGEDIEDEEYDPEMDTDEHFTGQQN